MRRIITISLIIMNLSQFFGCKAQNENDPYWKFNEKEHFRPELNKGEFFKLSGYDFGWLVLKPLSKFIKNKEQETERSKSFSYGQKALYYWWYLDGQVTNGGFVQFYYNGYGPYVPTIIKGLEHIGDHEMASLIKKADKIYQKNKKLVTKAQESDLFGGDLYERLEKLSFYDEKYYELNEKTMSLIENYIRKNPNEICLDEEGKEFDLSYSGACKTYFENKKIKEKFELEKGVINGTFDSFYENGNLKEKIHYIKGKQTGEREEYFENGKLKYQVLFNSQKKFLIHKWYHENGNPKKIETKLADKDERFGAYTEWYKNGQLSKTGTYKSAFEREGEWLEFHKDGSKKVEARFVNGDFRLINHWNDKGEQTLINGTGLYTYEYSLFDDKVDRNEHEYKDYKRHGVQKNFTNSTLTLYQEMENGKRHGITRSYYNNGNLKEELVYKNGESISKKKFPKFKNPKVATTVVSRVCEGCYKEYADFELPDNEPKPMNHLEVTKEFKAESSIFEDYGDDYVLSYGYFVFVNKKGNVDDVKFAVADNGWLDEEVKLSMAKLKFEPALKNGETIKSIHYVRYRLKLIESKL